MAKIKIGKKNYTVKSTVRALFIFERITKKSFEVNSLLDNYIYIYSILLANNPDMSMTWDEFIDYLDNDPSILTKLNKAIADEQKVDEVYTKTDDKDEADVKKD